MIKYGTVSIVNYKTGKVKVTFEDIEEQSDELIVYQGRNKGKKEYSMPIIGERGLCLLVDNGNTGYYLGSGYDNKEPIIPGGDKGKNITLYSDGTEIIYDENTSKLFVNCKKDIEIICPKIKISGDIEIIGDIKLNGKLDSTGDITAEGVSLINHSHGGVTPGSGDTGKPKK